MNQPKKSAAEACRDAVRVAQKALARATAAAAKAELPLERKLHAIGGELYGMADLLAKATAPAHDPAGTVDNAAAFAPLPLRTPAEVVSELAQHHGVGHLVRPVVTIGRNQVIVDDEPAKAEEPTHAQAA